jgi:hypothetical protein
LSTWTRRLGVRRLGMSLHRVSVSPSLVVSCLALFMALGGSALALGTRTAKTVRCSSGAPRAVATVVGLANLDPQGGLFALPSSWTSSRKYFDYAWSCSGQAIQVKAMAPGPNSDAYGFDIRFPGDPGRVAMVSSNAIGTLARSVSPSKQFPGFEVQTAAYSGARYGSTPGLAMVTVVLY